MFCCSRVVVTCNKTESGKSISASEALRFGIEAVGADHVMAWQHTRDEAPSDFLFACLRKAVLEICKYQLPGGVRECKCHREFLLRRKLSHQLVMLALDLRSCVRRKRLHACSFKSWPAMTSF